jgi:type I restriction enzyme R subunit
VLRNYIQDGVDELDMSKLSTMLTSKYGGIHAAQQALGNVEDIQKVFVDFQQFLYTEKVA